MWSPNSQMCPSALRWSGFGRQLYRNRVSRRSWTLLWRRAPLDPQLRQKVRVRLSHLSVTLLFISFSFWEFSRCIMYLCLFPAGRVWRWSITQRKFSTSFASRTSWGPWRAFWSGLRISSQPWKVRIVSQYFDLSIKKTTTNKRTSIKIEPAADSGLILGSFEGGACNRMSLG